MQQLLTFKDLKKRISLEIAEQRTEVFGRLLNKPFWIWNIEEHKQEDIMTNGNCCFNHIIGLPTKEGVEKAMFDYEKILYDSIFLVNDVLNLNHNHTSFKYKHLWVKKQLG
ncbi:MAG: hypothetical protein ACJ72R_06725 [Nitrososphaeraceae archaeon]